MDSQKQKALLKSHTYRLSFQDASYEPLVSAVGDAEVVLIGDGSHGTYEFYAHRANLTRHLTEEKGFNAVAVEADWPDAFRINRYIHGGTLGDGTMASPRDALSDFERFPKWMWKNEVMPPFIRHLREHNEKVMRESNDASNTVSFYGMDLYSLHRSADEVVKYLEKVDPEGAKAARKKYNCFERFGEDTTRYAFAAQFGLSKSCHKEVILNLKSLLKNHQKYIDEQRAMGGGFSHPAEEQFVAEMNALVVKDAEEYYRTMLTEDAHSWNLRDEHFARTLVKIAEHMGSNDSHGGHRKAKIVVWAHNSHVGDARATDMGRRRGELNVGQLCRELFGESNVFNVGFLTNRGTVTAAYNWDDPPHWQRMNPPIENSIERVFDDNEDDDSFVITHRIEKGADGQNKKVEVASEMSEYLNRPRYQRFIGVIYRKDTERPSHYSKCSVADQYDAVAHLKESRGIQPLEPEDTWKGPVKGELDLTFPFGY
ncbi:hypothetical protein CERSUDRAFT_110312 [Gelatoporia subvermispora B]|uniref:Erythromycin esterase n=1 Tax=Ceriporiopsis subvermispora (strain B) TaxID=914234 RepID=M2RBA5_CERS8|nr:hypothetical protein CERSUDRAFT_110312 [Gelatoporia subvermispora B]